MWLEDGISCSEGWFFYLEPISGRLPDDTYEILAKKGIYVINPGDYVRDPNSKHGITINVVAYLKDPERLERDLVKLMDVLWKLIIT